MELSNKRWTGYIQPIKRVWIVIGRNGYVSTESVATSKAKSIKKFIEVLPPLWTEPWSKYEMCGYVCKRVNITVEIDKIYSR